MKNIDGISLYGVESNLVYKGAEAIERHEKIRNTYKLQKIVT